MYQIFTVRGDLQVIYSTVCFWWEYNGIEHCCLSVHEAVFPEVALYFEVFMMVTFIPWK